MEEGGLGLPLKGGMLTRIPASSSTQEAIAALNEIIDKLNTWNGVIVKQGSVRINVSDAISQSFSVPHGLGYAPIPFAYLNGIGLTITESDSLNVPLPTFLGLDAGLLPGAIVETANIKCMVDEENLYIVVFNNRGIDLGEFVVSYYLMRITSDNAV